MTTNEQALRNAIAERPHDWTPRLVLADFLDDTGEPHHAEEAARIRQAADPGTPLGRAVQHSFAAFAATHEASRTTGQKATVSTVGYAAIEELDSVLHGQTINERRAAARRIANYHSSFGGYHTTAPTYGIIPGTTSSHAAAANHHNAAAEGFREYARTL